MLKCYRIQLFENQQINLRIFLFVHLLYACSRSMVAAPSQCIHGYRAIICVKEHKIMALYQIHTFFFRWLKCVFFVQSKKKKFFFSLWSFLMMGYKFSNIISLSMSKSIKSTAYNYIEKLIELVNKLNFFSRFGKTIYNEIHGQNQWISIVFFCFIAIFFY